MHWQSLLAVTSIVAIATVAGGAAFRLGTALGSAPVGATMLLVGVSLLAAVVLTVASRRRSSTPYW